MYLASDSEDEEVEDPDAIRAKYKSLLGGSDDDADGRDAPQEDMEITFISGLSEKAAGRMEAKKQEEERKNESVFETQLRKRREKKKERRKDRETGNVKEDDDLVEDPLVDGEDVIDEEDPFFQLDDESDFEPVAPKAPVKKEDVAPKKKNAKKTKEELQEEGRSKAELELLFMDENATSERHFNMKSVIQAEKESKRKRNRKKKTKGPELGDTQDDFQLDVQDSRFADIIDSHHFAIDPTNPQFKKTKNMDKLLQMRRDQRAKTVDQVVENAATGPKQEKVRIMMNHLILI